MGPSYDPHAIESHWRRRWEAAGVGRVDLDLPGPVSYLLLEFPYPSAEGLHVGHVFRYAGVDAFGRYTRMQGHRVFQPIGFDAFGIHTENFALASGEHPAALTKRTTVRFRQQLERMGGAWDWSRIIDTSDPAYYRWTQWMLLRLFEAGLMYQADAAVVWCPSCLTVLANEQTEDEGTSCERCGSAVEERTMRQWFLRITEYADRLVEGLDHLDWPERAKRMQRNWIGRTDDALGLRLRDWLISRQRYWGPPIPIVHCPECGTVPVPDEDLPVLLPEVDDVRPPGTGDSPLAAVDKWVTTTCPQCGGRARRETDVADTFVDSSWYFLRYPSSEFDDRPWDPGRTAHILPVDFYAGGPEHVQRHHLYARFVTMALHDLGLVPFEEPFPHIRLGGVIVHDGAKMSKSRGNVVSPDPYVERHGSDVLRCALLFSAPWDRGGDFTDDAVSGVERFFARVWRTVAAPDADGGPAEQLALAEATPAVGEAIERMAFNVALARLMELTPHIRSLGGKNILVRMLAPLAPHLAEELWHRLGEPFSVHEQPWPAADPTKTAGEIEIPVQVDGRIRGTVVVPADAGEAEVLAAARASVGGFPQPDGIARVIHVPGRMLSVVSR